jgi:FtsZ-interacting cell division protein ZipA
MAEDIDNPRHVMGLKNIVIAALIISVIALIVSVWAMKKAQNYPFTERGDVESTNIPPNDPSDDLMRGTGQPPTQ